jgi:hypothetical protein
MKMGRPFFMTLAGVLGHKTFGAMRKPLELDGGRSSVNRQAQTGAEKGQDDCFFHDFPQKIR